MQMLVGIAQILHSMINVCDKEIEKQLLEQIVSYNEENLLNLGKVIRIEKM